jgi:hypothetical protein
MAVSSENLRFILGLKLRTLRHDHGASLKTIADRSGLSVSYLSEIEKGRKYPKPDKLLDLAEALEVNYDDLVSLHVDDKLGPLKKVFSSTFIEEFPFETFGLEPHDVLGLVSDAPARSGALIQAVLEIGRAYDMHVEHFLFAALRSYQQLHGNYFAELEAHAATVRAQHGWMAGAPVSAALLREALTSAYGYRVDVDTLPAHPHLSDLRSVYVEDDPPTLLVNGDLMPVQQAFVFAREIGYCELDVEQRARTSSWLKVQSYDQLLNNYKASYFAGALLIEREPLLRDIEDLFGRRTWHPEPWRRCMARHHATPEMLYYRLTELAPHDLGLDDFFFLRFHHEAGSKDFHLTKLLNMSTVPVPHGMGLQEHYCHRWPAIQLLKDMAAQQARGALSTHPSAPPQMRAQRSNYLNEGAEFFVLSTARPLALQPGTNSCVSIGFLLNDRFRERVAFWQDPSIPSVDVNLTCERCALQPEECRLRVAPPSIHEAQERQRRKEEALSELTALMQRS